MACQVDTFRRMESMIGSYGIVRGIKRRHEIRDLP
jgi:hypothetical protein